MPKAFAAIGTMIEAYVRTKQGDDEEGEGEPAVKELSARRPAARALSPKTKTAILTCRHCKLAGVEYPLSFNGEATTKIQCPRCAAVLDPTGKVLEAPQEPPGAPAPAPATETMEEEEARG